MITQLGNIGDPYKSSTINVNVNASKYQTQHQIFQTWTPHININHMYWDECQRNPYTTSHPPSPLMMKAYTLLVPKFEKNSFSWILDIKIALFQQKSLILRPKVHPFLSKTRFYSLYEIMYLFVKVRITVSNSKHFLCKSYMLLLLMLWLKLKYIYA